jgi:hypothetical protein
VMKGDEWRMCRRAPASNSKDEKVGFHFSFGLKRHRLL